MCPLLLTRKTLPPILFDLDDVEHVTFLCAASKNSGRGRFKLLQYSRLPALLWGELRAIRLAPRTFVCSEKDRNYLAKRWRLPGVVTIPNSDHKHQMPAVDIRADPSFLRGLLVPAERPGGRLLDRRDLASYLTRRPICSPYRGGFSARARSVPIPRRTPGVEFTGFVDDLEGFTGARGVVCLSDS